MNKVIPTFGLIATIILILIVGSLFIPENEPANELAAMLPADGTPVLMLQNRVGDDVLPHIHQTYCQLLPYKRHIQDDQVFCYVEAITDWDVER